VRSGVEAEQVGKHCPKVLGCHAQEMFIPCSCSTLRRAMFIEKVSELAGWKSD
jgi:hypothetical protein